MRKKNVAMGLISVLLTAGLLFIACGTPGRGRANMTPGTFTATADGFPGAVPMGIPAGSISVSVVLSANRIESVTVTENTDREPFRTITNTRIPAAIVEHQSIGVDVVSGATFTSLGIRNAVADAIVQAGGDPARFMARPRVRQNRPVTITTDVLVVGSGISGTTAAIEAAYAGAEVLVIEKLGFLGGVTSASAGMIHGYDTSVMRAFGITNDRAEYFVDELIKLSMDLPAPGIPAMLRQIAGLSQNTIEWMINNIGINFSPTPTAAWRGTPIPRAHTPGGAQMMSRMIEYARRQNVEFMSDVKAESLIMEGARVVGVRATDKTGGNVTINARVVILATGGFHNNNELMDMYHPMVRRATGHANRWHLPGHYGQGLIMARDNANAAIVQMPVPISGIGGMLPWGIWVTPSGNRYQDESYQYALGATAILFSHADYHYQWTIMDNTNRPDNLTVSENVFRASSLGGLAAAIGYTGQAAANFTSNLQAAINAYNAALASGGAAAIPFASPLGHNTVMHGAEVLRARHLPIDLNSEYFWAQRSGAFGDIWGTRSGLKIELDGQVVSTGGSPIPGLFAAGEVVGYILPVKYGGSGMAITTWANQARIAGRAAGAIAR